jgi:hypothetical protein
MLTGNRHREHVVTLEEGTRYLAVAPAPLVTVAVVLLDTAMRPDECYRLRWESVNWSNGRNGTVLVTHGNGGSRSSGATAQNRVRHMLGTLWESESCPKEGSIEGDVKRTFFSPCRADRMRMLLLHPATADVLGGSCCSPLRARCMGATVSCQCR